MLSAFLSVLMLLSAFRLPQGEPLPFEMRARTELLFGKGETTSASYYDVIVTRQADAGVAVKLPYTLKGGRFHFDLHHRLAVAPDFEFPAEVITVVEVITGGTNSLGTFTISGKIENGKFEENIKKVSTAEVDRYITVLGRKTITISTQPGPQAVSIVGKYQAVTRGSRMVRVEAPGARMAVVSNIGFEDAPQTNPLKKAEP